MLRRGAILVPLDAPDLERALTSSFRAVSGVSDEVAENLASDLVRGAAGEICPVHERVVVALAESDAVEDVCAVIGVSPVGFTGAEIDGVSVVGGDERGTGGAPPAAPDDLPPPPFPGGQAGPPVTMAMPRNGTIGIPGNRDIDTIRKDDRPSALG